MPVAEDEAFEPTAEEKDRCATPSNANDLPCPEEGSARVWELPRLVSRLDVIEPLELQFPIEPRSSSLLLGQHTRQALLRSSNQKDWPDQATCKCRCFRKKLLFWPGVLLQLCLTGDLRYKLCS